jgi:hypothetical protein
MALMTVNNQNPHQQAGDCQAQPRWSAGKKTEAVLRLLRGEPLEELSRELKVEGHRLASSSGENVLSGRSACTWEVVRPLLAPG